MAGVRRSNTACSNPPDPSPSSHAISSSKCLRAAANTSRPETAYASARAPFPRSSPSASRNVVEGSLLRYTGHTGAEVTVYSNAPSKSRTWKRSSRPTRSSGSPARSTPHRRRPGFPQRRRTPEARQCRALRTTRRMDCLPPAATCPKAAWTSSTPPNPPKAPPRSLTPPPTDRLHHQAGHHQLRPGTDESYGLGDIRSPELFLTRGKERRSATRLRCPRPRGGCRLSGVSGRTSGRGRSPSQRTCRFRDASGPRR
jgi:hypothetical protein